MRNPTTAGIRAPRENATCDVRVPASVAMPRSPAIELHRQTGVKSCVTRIALAFEIDGS
jgi:hypothetical protein